MYSKCIQNICDMLHARNVSKLNVISSLRGFRERLQTILLNFINLFPVSSENLKLILIIPVRVKRYLWLISKITSSEHSHEILSYF